MRAHPHLYEINALIFLRRMSAKHGRQLSLASIPQEEWQELARQGFDLIWLMGVWKRSPEARKLALASADLRRYGNEVLPGWNKDDVLGSPYAVHDYVLDPALGAEGDLARVKVAVNRAGMGLILDFVPNHLALDHPWTRAHPERFVGASEAESKPHADLFYKSASGAWLAHGRDPYFPSWSDTVQVNFFSPEMREALVGQLERIAEVADGARCDMAMLGLNRIFASTWGAFTRDFPLPAEEFWPGAIARARKRHPDFLFLAEVYWDLEWELQQLGFDFTYDKKLYDRLRAAPVADIRGHLRAEPLFQKRSARFIENHDEQRAANVLGREGSQAAAVIMATVPGMRFFHDGQLEGRRLHLPIQFAREPHEEVDLALARFYDRLLRTADAPVFHTQGPLSGPAAVKPHEGWMLLEPGAAWEGDQSWQNFLAWMWLKEGDLAVVIVNYSKERSQGRVRIPLPAGAGSQVRLKDDLSGHLYLRTAGDLRTEGLYVDLVPWQAHILTLS